jgi:NADPH2:quinone reductase
VQTVAAIVVRRFGGPEVLEPTELELPSPGPGRVAIEVELAGVTFVETQLRAGRAPRPEMMPRLPWVPGNGVAGTVTELGDGVDPALLGTRVASTTGGSGGYAGRVEVDAEAPVPVPGELTLDAATALLADGRTAIRLAAAAAIRDGERVLVEAAAGGVGSLLVQLARGAGATVVAAASEARKLAVAAELGAAETVDYSRPDWPKGIEPRSAAGPSPCSAPAAATSPSAQRAAPSAQSTPTWRASAASPSPPRHRPPRRRCGAWSSALSRRPPAAACAR